MERGRDNKGGRDPVNGHVQWKSKSHDTVKMKKREFSGKKNLKDCEKNMTAGPQKQFFVESDMVLPNVCSVCGSYLT